MEEGKKIKDESEKSFLFHLSKEPRRSDIFVAGLPDDSQG
jgi:hypothetical protein